MRRKMRKVALTPGPNTIVRVHRHGQGAKEELEARLPASPGGLTTKILALTDALGSLVRVVVLPG